MKIVDRATLREILEQRRARDRAVREKAAGIISGVESRGDAALREYTSLFDGVEISAFRVPEGEIDAAAEGFLDREWRARLKRAAARIRRFAAREKPRGFTIREKGGVLEKSWVPVQSAGVYVPAGTAPLVSTVLMSVIPAQVAGVPRIALCSPPGRDGRVNEAVLAAAGFLGVREIYRLGGAQAVAALALGTETIPRVRLVAGPGNEYVAEAKRLLYGRVALDCPAGPSEVAVYADGTARITHVLAELAAQAEHHAGISFLVTSSGRMREAAGADPTSGYVLAAANEAEAVEIINDIAPEHLVLVCREARRVAALTTNAGAVFIGPYSPVALGDYLAGPSHVLPTGGTAASFSGLSTLTFLRGVARIEWNREGLAGLAGDIAALAELEGLPAHRESVRRRLDGGSGSR